MLHTHLHLYIALTQKTNGRSLGTFQKAMLFRKPGSIGYNRISSSFILDVSNKRVNTNKDAHSVPRRSLGQ